MAVRYSGCIVNLMKNDEEDFFKSANILIKIARNIVAHPGETKYKSIQIGSRTFMESILPYDGAVECLYEMGFIEKDDRYVFSDDQSDDNLKIIKSQLENAVEEKKNKNNPSLLPAIPKYTFDQLHSESNTYNKMYSHFENVLIYENTVLQEKARAVIPVKILHERAQKRLSKAPEFARCRTPTRLQKKDCLLLELMHWFKHEFFTWTDSPKCETCFNGKSISTGMLSPTSEELRWGAQRVEGSRCSQCRNELRYPRYNNPEKLLETRTGRCGEWANCFTLLCRSLGFDARHVIDWTDHVWTEVYSDTAGRWLHCDPCENICDKPLLYEQGWGKKLSLIIAVSCEEIVDVTWRYTNNISDVLERRKALFRENWLRDKINELKESRKMQLPTERRKHVELRSLKEIVDLLSPKFESSNNYGGRTTGSLQWRKARGELGSNVNDQQNTTIQPNAQELNSQVIDLRYSPVMDKYMRRSNSEDIEGWESLVYSSKNMMRKEENDWRTVYLSRIPSSQRAHICWKINLNEGMTSSCFAKEISVFVNSTVFESGKVNWLLCTEKSTIPIRNGVKCKFTNEVIGASTISLYAFLSGGNGEQAWQHTQLFRQSMDGPNDETPFRLIIKLMPRK